MIASRRCYVCGEDNSPRRHFCRRCGVSLEIRCAQCGFTNLLDDRFCGGCGESLDDENRSPAAQWQPAGRHVGAADGVPLSLRDDGEQLEPEVLTRAESRLATIVKADLSGFTAMSEKLNDPEEVTVIMNQVFDPLVSCVRRYNGHIDNYAGDMIISFFGSPHALQDGAERAVRAALEMRDEVARLNARNISHGVELGISTGIATGHGLWSEVGFGNSARRTLTGELGDYTALLEKYAERGTVGVCPDTYERVRHVIPAEEQEQHVTPPGESESRPMYFAGPPQPRKPWLDTAGANALPLIGRQGMLDQLLAAWNNATAGETRVIHLWGEAGVGKTRLAYELAQTVIGAGEPVYAAYGRPLSAALGDDMETELRHAMLTAHRVSLSDSEARASWLSSLGLPPRSEDAAEWLRASLEQRPGLVILDGLDWLSDWPERLVKSLNGRPVLMVLVSREPEVSATLDPPPHREYLEVTPLPREAVDDLALQMLGHEPDAETADWLWRWSGGSPLLAREFHALLTNHGGIPPEVERLPWRVQELADVHLDTLSVEDRRVALAAAAAAEPEGLSFEPGLVAYLIREPQWANRLRSLQREGVLIQAAGNRGRYAFRHRTVWHACRRRLVGSVLEPLERRAQEARDRIGG